MFLSKLRNTKRPHKTDQVIDLDTDNALAYYNKGCAKALMSSEEEALSLIRKAITLDSTFKGKAKGDPDLEILRKNSGFRKLLES
jgi:hypothetical protein